MPDIIARPGKELGIDEGVTPPTPRSGTNVFRSEAAFARIERWTHRDTGDVHWRTTTGDNVTSIYGRSRDARIADPDDPRRVLPCAHSPRVRRPSIRCVRSMSLGRGNGQSDRFVCVDGVAPRAAKYSLPSPYQNSYLPD